MKIFGHPLHMMLIHFPSALFPMDLICYGIYYFSGQTSFAMASFYALAGGVALGWLAVVFGTFDLLNIPNANKKAMNRALIHGGINVTVVIIYSGLFYSLFKTYPQLPASSLALLVSKVCFVSFMIVGNYMGGDLILRYNIAHQPQKP